MQTTTMDEIFGDLNKPPREKTEWEKDLEKIQDAVDRIKK